MFIAFKKKKNQICSLSQTTGSHCPAPACLCLTVGWGTSRLWPDGSSASLALSGHRHVTLHRPLRDVKTSTIVVVGHLKGHAFQLGLLDRK